MLRQSELKVEKNFQTQAFQKGMNLLRTKSRDNVGAMSATGQQLLTSQGKLTVFVG